MGNNDDLEVLWSVHQVATYLGVKPITVYRWISERRTLDPATIVRFGKNVRIPRSEVERLTGKPKEKIADTESPL